MKYLLVATLVFAFTQCAPTNPVKIAGYDVTDKDEIRIEEVPCDTQFIVHGTDTFMRREFVSAYKLDENGGYLLRFKDRKGNDKLTYVVETDSACQVMKVTTAFPMNEK